MLPTVTWHPAFHEVTLIWSDAGTRHEFTLIRGEVLALASELLRAERGFKPWILAHFEPADMEGGRWRCRKCSGDVGPGRPDSQLVDQLAAHRCPE